MPSTFAFVFPENEDKIRNRERWIYGTVDAPELIKLPLGGKYDVAGTVKYFTVNETVTGRVTCTTPAWPLTWHHQTVWQHHCPLCTTLSATIPQPSTSLSVLTIDTL